MTFKTTKESNNKGLVEVEKDEDIAGSENENEHFETEIDPLSIEDTATNDQDSSAVSVKIEPDYASSLNCLDSVVPPILGDQSSTAAFIRRSATFCHLCFWANQVKQFATINKMMTMKKRKLNHHKNH